ncbi:MAG: FAD:protein FMN transferase [Candidatus Woesearchaeota archaeon]
MLTRKQTHLATVFVIKLPEQHENLFAQCFLLLEEFEKTYSRFLPTSLLSKVNKQLNTWQTVDEQTFSLFEKGVDYYTKTEGEFTLTLKTQLEQLGYDPEYSFTKKNTVPFSQHDEPILLNKQTLQVYLKQEVEFGGFGKGFAVDMLAKFLDQHHVESYFISGGGDIRVKGQWPILLEHPLDATKALGKVTLDNGAIASSSSNRRKWSKAHHLLNAKTGLPQNELLAIFVLANTASDADAYATALFGAGLHKAIELSKKLSLAVYIITSDKKVYKSDTFIGKFF